MYAVAELRLGLTFGKCLQVIPKFVHIVFGDGSRWNVDELLLKHRLVLVDDELL